MSEYVYDSPRDFLRFLRDLAEKNSKANWNDDKVWKNEFKFIMIEIDEFLIG